MCVLQKAMGSFARSYDVPIIPSDNTGIFVSPTQKLGSIGVQVRHRLTTHGFALNVTDEPIPWFREVVACGLHGVNAVSLAGLTGRDLSLKESIPGLLGHVETHFKAPTEALSEAGDAEISELIREVEGDASAAGEWAQMPGESQRMVYFVIYKQCPDGEL